MVKEANVNALEKNLANKFKADSKKVETEIIHPYKDKDGNTKLLIKLIHPIEYGEGEVYKEFTFKKPKAKHMRNLNITNMKMGDMIDLIATLSDEPPSLIGELEIPDLQNINEKLVEAFF